MKRRYSLRRRLGLGVAFGGALTWLIGVLVAGFVVRHELDEAFDSALQETAQRLLSLAVYDIMQHEGAPPAQRITPMAAHDEYLTYVVRDRDGNVILQSHNADPELFPTRPETGFHVTATHRIYGEAAVSETIFIEVAEPLDHPREAAFETTLALAVPLALFCPFIILGAWWLIRRSMRPILFLRTQIEARGAGDLSPVSADGLPEEVGPIADAVNRLMQRLNQSLQAERSFVANSSHEIRTPIAGALAQTQRLVASLTDRDLRERARGIEQSLLRLARISEKLLQLARAEGGGVVTDHVIDLGPVLDAVVDEFRRGPDVRGRLAGDVTPPDLLLAPIDADAFGIMIRNLIENALKYSPEASVVKITSAPGEVRIINDGPALSGEVLARITRPFARGHAQVEGSGLGLAIVSTIASSAGIGLAVHSPARGQKDGFEVVIDLRGAGEEVPDQGPRPRGHSGQPSRRETRSAW